MIYHRKVLFQFFCVSLQRSLKHRPVLADIILGVTGFDSKTNCRASMPSLAVTLANLDCKKLIGENNYALAA